MRLSSMIAATALATLAPTLTFAQAQVPPESAPEVTVMIDLCSALAATGADVRDALVARDWVEAAEADRRAALTDLAGAHLWSFLPDASATERLEMYDRLLDGMVGVANGTTGTVLSFGAERVLILWQGDSLSCLWAGPQSETTDEVAQLIGGFPATEGTTTITRMQTIEADGRTWIRQLALGRTPEDERPSALPDAARVDRSPQP